MLRAAAVFMAAVPFLFGAIRAIGTGMTDLRYLAMAVVSHVATMSVLVMGRAGEKPRSGVVALAALAFVAATLLAFAAAWMVGARNVFSMLLVAGGFGCCSALGNSLTSLFPRR